MPYQPHRIYPIEHKEQLLTRNVGFKQYELADHLGNVRVVVGDVKAEGTLLQDAARILAYNNFYAFGMTMPGRTFNSNVYRFGFNGQEKVDEISGSGNHNTALYGEYDTRLGRRWNRDPKPNPSISSYAVFADNPIWFSDIPLDTPTVGNRIMGGLKVLGGGLEMTAGLVGGAATSWTGVGAIAGGAAVVHGADVTTSGIMQIWTGEEQQTFTQQGISKGLQTAGVSENTANTVAGYTDASISIALTAGSSPRPTLPPLVTATGPTKYVNLFKPINEFDRVKTIYRGTTGSEAGSTILFLTDDAAVAATYVKNGGQVMQYELSSFEIKYLEQAGNLTYKTGIHGAAGKVSTEFVFYGEDVVKALNLIAKPFK